MSDDGLHDTLEQGRFHSGLAFLSVGQETIVVRWEQSECDGEVNNRLLNCRRCRRRKQIQRICESASSTIQVNEFIAIYRQLCSPAFTKQLSTHSMYHRENVAAEPSASRTGLSPVYSLRRSSHSFPACFPVTTSQILNAQPS